MELTLQDLFDYLDDLSGADLLDSRSSSKLATAKLKAANALEHLKNVIQDLDNADLLPIPEEEEGFPSGEEIVDFLKF